MTPMLESTIFVGHWRSGRRPVATGGSPGAPSSSGGLVLPARRLSAGRRPCVRGHGLGGWQVDETAREGRRQPGLRRPGLGGHEHGVDRQGGGGTGRRGRRGRSRGRPPVPRRQVQGARACQLGERPGREERRPGRRRHRSGRRRVRRDLADGREPIACVDQVAGDRHPDDGDGGHQGEAGPDPPAALSIITLGHLRSLPVTKGSQVAQDRKGYSRNDPN